MKRILMGSVAVGVFSMATAALASMTIRYENKDSKAYQAEVVCSGSKQSPAEFRASTTASVSLQGSTPCKVTLGGQTHEFKGDVKIVIKDGKISVQ